MNFDLDKLRRSDATLDKCLKDCEGMIQKSLNNPLVKTLREQMEKAGCPVKDKFFKATICLNSYGGVFTPGKGITVCANKKQNQDNVTQVIIHELIHAFDDCRAANMDWTNCAHHACSEVRAGHLSGDCHYKRELLRGFLRIKGHEQECIKRRVMKSLASNPFCAGSAAKDSMDAVWNTCYNDTAPFEKAP
ncbi:mitochondrial inner membrane protease ATP23-like [Vicia villosa]|uniref:mitochondrial inner membrane protease ATP23-like n=1 Tax=Vicia villosa TaxID=3911 RepID=UPI00273C006D|nr:mitochondrial inner membrane protease ATP23-like [Vicia villosa]XP_058754459.1 mitochondrial inner membrane protease ATP23-like [Vicia villosa]XP_058754460.1 mitochondrial inner membrane protease ATP23-like [Vicia villosa]XP_058754461.1 mitochondrial inner membrane protease ATP23-like [Vicia villosa]